MTFFVQSNDYRILSCTVADLVVQRLLQKLLHISSSSPAGNCRCTRHSDIVASAFTELTTFRCIMSDDFPSLYTPSASASAEAGPSTFTGGPTSARALEQMHEQAEATTSSAQGGPSRSQLDLGSESAFPSLGAPSKVGAAGSASRWGVAAARSKAAAPSIPQPSAPLYTETLVLPSSSINVSPAPSSGSNSRNSPAGSDATTLGGVINHLMTRYPHVKIEASSSTFKQTTTFLFKALRQQDVERVKVELKTRIVRKVHI